MNFFEKHASNKSSKQVQSESNRRSAPASVTQFPSQARRANIEDVPAKRNSYSQTYVTPTSSRSRVGSRFQHPHDARNKEAGKNKSNNSSKTVNTSRSRKASVTSNPSQEATRKQRYQKRNQDFVRYAQDNVFVRTFYELTTGPYKVIVFLIFALVCVSGIYFPLKDMYCAMRTQQDLTVLEQTQQEANDEAQAQIDQYMSQEGIEDIARTELGLVMPGETAGVVVGVDEDGNALPDESSPDEESESSTATDPNFDVTLPFGPNTEEQNEESSPDAPVNPLEEDEHPVLGELSQNLEEKEDAQKAKKYADVPWYYAIGDFIFGYKGATGQTIVSTGGRSIDASE